MMNAISEILNRRILSSFLFANYEETYPFLKPNKQKLAHVHVRRKSLKKYATGKCMYRTQATISCARLISEMAIDAHKQCL